MATPSCSRQGGLGRGHTKETGNRKATAISENCHHPQLEHMLLNAEAQIKETATKLEE
jgi:hypothetical protein